MPAISLILPCRNEERYLAACLASLVPQLDSCDELLIIDGVSEDRTRTIAATFAARDARIRVVDNPRRHAASALNLGVQIAAGEIIVRVDAHCIYPPDYVRRLAAALHESGADNVGAAWRIAPGAPTAKALAIARALAHPFGAGTARFRRGTSTPRWVDTVPFGCFRRSTFERIGLFREELRVNQDDELNARLLNQGGKVLLLPDLYITYFARDTLLDLWRTYSRYGHYKPLALKLAGRAVTYRQFLPAGWLVAMVGSAAWTASTGSYRPWMLVWGAYVGAALSVAAFEGWRERRMAFAAWLFASFVTMHVAYGAGWWSGVPRAFRRAVRADETGAAQVQDPQSV